MASRDRLTAGAAVVGGTAAIALWANRELSSDVYFLIAGGRYVIEHGFPHADPFATINAGGEWIFAQWLTGVVFHLVHEAVGMAGLEVAYGLLLGAAMIPLVAGCRDRSWRAIAATWLLLLPTLVAVLDPRAAGFSLAAFSLTIVLVTGYRRTWRIWLLPPLFLVWANLHAAWAAGMLLVGLVAVGALVDRVRLGDAGDPLLTRRFLALGLAVPAVLATPVGHGVFRYMSVLAADPILPVLSFEWQPTVWHPWLVVYVIAVAGFGIALWLAHPTPRPLEPLVVLLGFCAFAMTASRQLIWLGPIAFYALRTLGRPATREVPRAVARAALTVAVIALGAWAIVDAPRPAEPRVLTTIGDYAAIHRPASGRLVTTTGLGSYLEMRAPDLPITVDGRLENYPAATIDRDYGILHGHAADLPWLERWDVGGVITYDPAATAPLEARGFRVVYRTPDGLYLVRGAVVTER